MSHRISLTRIIAINWYGFNQIIDIDDITLISGAFGTGKSALLDLMQHVMLGDGWKANRAASGKKSRGRDLVGYCLCDTNYEEKGERHFLRRSGVTIIALEFTKPAQGSQAESKETWGIRIEYSNPSARPKKTHFCVPDRVESGDLQEGDTLFDEDRFRIWLRRGYGKDAVFPRQQDYLEEMATARHLYFDNKSFCLTFPKAIAFEQEENIETFIREFILEESPLNVAEVRESLHAYEDVRKRLEEQEHEAEFLRKIAELDVTFQEAARQGAVLRHVDIMLKFSQQKQLRSRHELEIKRLEAGNREDLENQQLFQTKLTSIEEQITRTEVALDRDPDAMQVKQLTERIDGNGKQLSKLREARKTVREFLQSRQQAWHDWLRHGQSLRIEEMGNVFEVASSVVNQLSGGSEIEGLAQLEDVAEQFREIWSEADRIVQPLVNQKNTLDSQLRGITADLKYIDDKQTPGKYPFFERLRREFGDSVEQLGRVVEVRPEADHWWPVIESLLGDERSAVLTSDFATYVKAREILAREGSSPHETLLNPEELNFAGSFGREEESIFSKLEVANEGAKARLLSCIGDVICCANSDEVEATNTPRALSVDGYFKDAPARRRLDAIGVSLTLGQRGLKRMKIKLLDEQAHKADLLEKIKLQIDDIQNWLDKGKLKHLGSSKKPQNIEQIVTIPALEKELGTDVATLELLQTPELLERVKLHADLKKDRDLLVGDIRLLSSNLANFATAVATPKDGLNKAQEKMHALSLDLAESQTDLSKRFSGVTTLLLEEQHDYWLNLGSSYSERFEELREKIAEVDLLAVQSRASRDNERRSISESRNEKGSLRHPHYKEFNFKDENNVVWDQRLKQLETIELDKSRSLAESRQSEWQRRLEEQVLNELKRRTDEAEVVIRSLRQHMKQPVGNYRYEIRQRRDTLNYGNLWPLLDSGFEGTDPLAEAIQESSIKTAMNDLMAAINTDSETGKRISKLLDYRNYHNYDMFKVPIGDETEGKQMTKGISLSRSGGNLSGGEGQVPFFISMLAAFRRVYSRSGSRSRSMNHLGLVVMDEAFSNLSGDGIADCLTLARSFELQLILAFPPEKLGVMVDHAQTVIVVQKDIEHDAEGLPTSIENTPILMTLDDAMEVLD